MKAIIIGTSASGKSTAMKYIVENYNLSVSEIDEELIKINNGKYPTDNEDKHNVLVPQIISNILNQEIIFFTNTDYFTVEDLKNARAKGFKILQIYADIKTLKERNKYRVDVLGWNDLSMYFEGMIEYQHEMQKAGVIDKVIDSKQPVEKVVEEIFSVIDLK